MTISSTSRPTLEARRGESPDPPSADPQLRVCWAELGEVSLVAFYVDGKSVGGHLRFRLWERERRRHWQDRTTRRISRFCSVMARLGHARGRLNLVSCLSRPRPTPKSQARNPNHLILWFQLPSAAASSALSGFRVGHGHCRLKPKPHYHDCCKLW